MREGARFLAAFLLLELVPFSAAAPAADHFIVRLEAGGVPIEQIISGLGFDLVGSLDGTLGETYLVIGPDYLAEDTLVELLANEDGVEEVEPDRAASISTATPMGVDQSTVALLNGVADNRPENYFGTTVWHGYLSQPATNIISLPEFQERHRPSSRRLIAIIDTGIDPDHPAFAGRLAGGYDFTRDMPGIPSELADLPPSTLSVVSGGVLDQSSVAVLNQSTVAVLNRPAADALGASAYPAFGHGTMVAGLVHLVQPRAGILSLKVFRADGTAHTSDIVRAIYYAVTAGADVINMSFSLPEFSPAVLRAINHAVREGVICVASAGNTNRDTLVYPAALSNVVGTASTTDLDARASFSNYGRDVAWLSAPGEGLITPYPAGTYAAVWGTSFSAALVSGAAAALLDAGPVPLVQGTSSDGESPAPRFIAPLVTEALSHGAGVSTQLGFARLHLPTASHAIRITLSGVD